MVASLFACDRRERRCGISITGNGNLPPETFGRLGHQCAPESLKRPRQTETARDKPRICRTIFDVSVFRSFWAERPET